MEQPELQAFLTLSMVGHLVFGVNCATLPYGASLGTGAAIFGTNDINNSTGVPDPVWQCFMDGISSGTLVPANFGNNQLFCLWDPIPDGPHVMSINATSKGQMFLIDVLRYSTAAGVSVDGGAIVFDSLDPDIHFNSQWVGSMTTTTGATMTLDFFGMTTCFFSPDRES